MNIQFPEGRDVKLRHAQIRIEKHGEDDQPAIDLAISVTGDNSLLDMLHPDLRAMLFKAVDTPNAQPGQQEMDLPVDERPSVRVPGLALPLKYDREQVGMLLKVAYGVTGKQDLVLGSVRLHKPKVAALIEGGSTELQFTLSTTDINEKSIGKLSLLQGHEITITLTPAEVDEEPADPGNDPAWPSPKDEQPQQEAGDIFAAAHAEGEDDEEAA
jgi:hypothetical protein